MGRADNHEDGANEKRKPPPQPRNIEVINKLRTLNSAPRAYGRRNKKKGAPGEDHKLAVWTRNLAIVTALLVAVGAIGDGLVYVTLQDTRSTASGQASATEDALRFAGDQAAAAASQASEAGVQIETARQTTASQEADTQSALKVARDQAEAAGAQASATGIEADAAKVTAQTAHEQMVANSRAWVGPNNGLLKAAPVLGQELDVTIQYQNTGRAPATDVFTDVKTDIKPDGSGIANQVVGYSNSCKATGIGNGVVYPTVGLGGGYQLNTSIAGPQIAQAVIDGKDLVWVYGCFVYRTLGEVHRSSFCFYFANSPTASIGNLSFCLNGQYAD